MASVMQPLVLSGVALLLAVSCNGLDSQTNRQAREWPTTPVTPLVFATKDRIQHVLSNSERQPWATVLAQLKHTSERPYRDVSTGHYDSGAEEFNTAVALAAATRAILYPSDGTWPTAMAAKAAEGIVRQRADVYNLMSIDGDLGVSVAAFRLALTLSLWANGPGWNAPQEDMLRHRVAEYFDGFYATWLTRDAQYTVIPRIMANNHNIRQAAAMAFGAALLRDDPRSQKWADYGYNELWWLLQSDESGYLVPEGGVGEGPHYFGVAMGVAFPFLAAARDLGIEQVSFRTQCWMRWPPCSVRTVTFDRQTVEDRLHTASLWWRDTRMPNGTRASIDDARLNWKSELLDAGMLFGEPSLLWDWANQDHGPHLTGFWYELFLLPDSGIPDSLPDDFPRNAIDARSGTAFIRSGLGSDDTVLGVLAEPRAAQYPNHENVDPATFFIYGAGQLMALDPGYVEIPETLIASDLDQHNGILIDGKGPTRRFILDMYGGTGDVAIDPPEPGVDNFVSVRASYQGAEIRRAFWLASSSSIWIIDRIQTPVARDITFVMAGNDNNEPGNTWFEPGSFELAPKPADPAIRGTSVAVATWHGSTTMTLAITSSTGEPSYSTRSGIHTLSEATKAKIRHTILDATVRGTDVVFLSHVQIGDINRYQPRWDYEYAGEPFTSGLEFIKAHLLKENDPWMPVKDVVLESKVLQDIFVRRPEAANMTVPDVGTTSDWIVAFDRDTGKAFAVSDDGHARYLP